MNIGTNLGSCTFGKSKTILSHIFMIFFLLFALLLPYLTNAQSTDNTFLSAIQSQGINTSNLSNSNVISRYDTVRLMSSVECIDCLNPPEWMKERYTLQRLRNFSAFPSNNFDDLAFPITSYKSLNYYYCTAYAAEQGYVNGYPRTTSPYCPGKFCGVANTSMAELVQIVFNITAKYSTVNYQVNRPTIKSWSDKLIPSDQAIVFDLDDLATIKQSAQLCTQDTCAQLTQAQLTAYAKYCTYNLSACKFTPFIGAGEKLRPVAQLNILIQEGIFTRTQAQDIASVITKLAPGSQIIDIFSTINAKTQCEFDNDYDKDTITNNSDNCSNISNPSQRDQDKDGIGDVCDCDIDGDGSQNGLGIVDDLGNIVSSKLTPPLTQDINRNGLYDQCEDIISPTSTLKGLWVSTDIDKLITQGWTVTSGTSLISGTLSNPLNLNIIGPNNGCFVSGYDIPFRCEYKGDLGELSWNFGDGTVVSAGCSTSHRYTKPGQYTIIARSNDLVSARTTITIAASQSQCVDNDTIASHMTATPLLQSTYQAVNYKIYTVNIRPNTVAQVSCAYGDGVTNIFSGSTLSQAYNQNHSYAKAGRYTTACFITLKDTRILINTATVTIENSDDTNDDDDDISDNCIFVPNSNQQDRNNNGIGDKCEDDVSDLIGLWVRNDAVCTYAPATINFACTYTGNIGDINRSFGDASTKTQGCNVAHRFTQAGNFTITATANSGVKASTTIKVIGTDGQQGLSLKTSADSVNVGESVTITPRTLGNIDKIEYISSMSTTTQSPNQVAVFTPRQAGTYSITAKAYRNNIVVAAAQIIISVTSPTQRTAGVTLTPSSLTAPANTPVRFTLAVSNITPSNIKSIQRDFGDGTSNTNSNLTLTKIYLEPGTKVITTTLTLDDNSSLIVMSTITVVGTTNQCLSSSMSATPLIQSVGLPVIYQISLINLGPDQITKITCDYGDGIVKVFRDNIQQNLTQPHVYLTAGRFTAQCTLTLKDGLLLPNSATVSVQGRDRCRDSSQYKCDMDGDTIPDICDEDIDGDETNNLMGLLLYETPSCIINDENTNLPLKQYEHQQAASGVKIDNCPFIINNDQVDDNGNGYGNVCEGGGEDDNVCILFDGTRYPGPCPIITDAKLPGLSTIQVKGCSKCPCAYVQGPADTVRSMLFNPQQTLLQVTGTTLSIK